MKPVLVVEGKTDVIRLQQLIDAEFIITNGSEVSRETILYIRDLSQKRPIYVLTDPDYNGEKIRAKIIQSAPLVKHLYIRKEFASNGKKLGVCECREEELLKALSFIKETDEKSQETLVFQDLMELNLTYGNLAKKRRYFLTNFYNIGHCNAKTLLKRLNALGVTKESLKKSLENFYDCK